jgi:hypothetical protein
MKPIEIGRYSTGQKRCQICEIFLKWDGLWCPWQLRPRLGKARLKVLEIQLGIYGKLP